jgi:hypothetical protein
MMLAIFATLFAALVLEQMGWGRSGLACLAVSLALTIYLFLWEIYSPDYGFKMPWLQVELEQPSLPVREA